MQLLKHVLVGAIRLYRRLVSPVLTSLFSPNGLCRFNPSCSEYALQAIQTHGALRGSWLALKRILRCNPWGSYGFDPVPPRHDHGCGCGHEHTELSPKKDRPDSTDTLHHGSLFMHRPTSS